MESWPTLLDSSGKKGDQIELGVLGLLREIMPHSKSVRYKKTTTSETKTETSKK